MHLFVLEIVVGVIALAFGLSSGKSIYSDPNSRRERNRHPQMVVKRKGIPPKMAETLTLRIYNTLPRWYCQPMTPEQNDFQRKMIHRLLQE